MAQLSEKTSAPSQQADVDALRRFNTTGAHAALDELFARHSDGAYRLALTLTHNAADAEDAVQAAFLKIVSRSCRFDERRGTSVRGWLMGIVINTVKHKRREDGRRRQRELNRGPASQEFDDGREQLAEEALSVVRELPEPYRVPVWLHYLEQLSFEEIAGALAIPASTARNHSHRGIEMARTQLAARGHFVASTGALAGTLAAAPLHAAPASLGALSAKILAAKAVTAGLGTGGVGTGATATASASVAGSGGTALATGITFKALAAVAAVTLAAGGAYVVKSNPNPARVVADAHPNETGKPGDKPGVKGNDRAPLGSLEFYPSPAKPSGWRGDWSGHYPGATPPTHWSRRVHGGTTDMKCQSKKPGGEPGADSRPIEYFTVREFLVLGPFSVTDPVKDLEADQLGGEATIEPDAGMTTAGLQWKPVHTSVTNQSLRVINEGTCHHLNVDFVYLFGKYTEAPSEKPNDKTVSAKVDGDFVNKVGYAHTYLYAPEAQKARLHLPYAGAGGRLWFNGVLTPIDKNLGGAYVDLIKGWNRVLVKVSCAKGKGPDGQNSWVSKWRCALYVTPEGPLTYDTKNISWMTPLTGRSMSQPIVVGQKLIFGANFSDLVCLDKDSGKVLWLRSNTPWDALTAEEQGQPQFKDKIEPMVKKLEQVNDETVALLNTLVTRDGMSDAQQATLQKKLEEKSNAEKEIHNAFATIDGKRFPRLYVNESSSSNGTPVSDGENVYWFCGGGRGVAGYVFCAYTLDGRRLWSAQESSYGGAEHGTQSSAACADGKVIYTINTTLLTRDTKTGKIVWQQKMPDKFNAESPVIVNLGGQQVIAGQFDWRYFSLFRLSDGTEYAQNDMTYCSEQTPVVENGVAYEASKFRNFGVHNLAAVAFKLPAPPAAPAAALTKLAPVWETETGGGPSYYIASPLVVDGRLYDIDTAGCISAIATDSGKELYHNWIDWCNRFDRSLYGVCASPTFAGKHIYLINDAGETILLKPGDTYAEDGHNLLENINHSDASGNPCKQEAFYTSPVFEGRALYLRGEEYMYRIEEKP